MLITARLIGQMGQYGEIDLVLSKALAVLGHAIRASPRSPTLRRSLSLNFGRTYPIEGL